MNLFNRYDYWFHMIPLQTNIYGLKKGIVNVNLTNISNQNQRSMLTLNVHRREPVLQIPCTV